MISIIVPVYNMRRYLKRCIESILNQTFKDFELLLIDDGSQDDSYEICQKYAQKDSRIRVIHKKNGGVSSARNLGLDIARGEYIMFCDSDDSWEPEMAKKAYESIVQKNVDSVGFNYTWIKEGKRKQATKFKVGKFEFNEVEDKLKYIFGTFMNCEHGFEVCIRILKKSIIVENDLRFCLTCNNYAEDMGFLIKYILASNSFYCSEECLYNYYVNEESMVQRSKSIIRLNDMCELAYYLEPFYREKVQKKMFRKQFSTLYYMILHNECKKVVGLPEYSTLGEVLKKIKRFEWHNKTLRRIFLNYKSLKFYVGKSNAQRILLLASYYIHRNWKLFCIESYIYYKFIYNEKNNISS